MPGSVLFKGQGIKITDAGVQIGRNSYRKEDITSVMVEEKPMPAGQRIGGVVVGLVLCMIVAILPRDAVTCGAPLALFGLAILISSAIGTKTYALKVGTTNGEVTAFTSANQGQVRKMERALEQHVLQARQGSSDQPGTTPEIVHMPPRSPGLEASSSSADQATPALPAITDPEVLAAVERRTKDLG